MRSFRFWLFAVLAGLLGVAVYYVLVRQEAVDTFRRPIISDSSITRLILVETPDFASSEATIKTFERSGADGAWQVVDEPAKAMIGRAGVGWAYTQREMAKGDEPIKQEGDKRAPAGLFRMGASFGAGPEAWSGYMQLTEGQQFCVDDVGSPKYGKIVAADEVKPGVSGEKMWEIGLYRRGLVVDYPTDRKAKTGSCIFIHVMKKPETPTVGCVAAAEETVARLQAFVNEDRQAAAIAIVPSQALGRLGLNLPR